VILTPQQIFITENDKSKVITIYPYKNEIEKQISDQTIIISK